METHQYGLNLLQCIIVFGHLHGKKSFIEATAYDSMLISILCILVPVKSPRSQFFKFVIREKQNK